VGSPPGLQLLVPVLLQLLQVKSQLVPKFVVLAQIEQREPPNADLQLHRPLFPGVQGPLETDPVVSQEVQDTSQDAPKWVLSQSLQVSPE